MAKKILIVDDEPDICQLVSEALAEIGYEAISAANGKEALEAASKNQLDLFILDIYLPDTDGVVLYELLLGIPIYERTPIIFLTALAHGTSPQLAGIHDTAYSILPKPTNFKEIQKEVMRLLA